MTPELQEREDPIERQLQAALRASDDDEARYHLREALQLRIAEKSDATTGE
ncbi:hypothetical protein SAMN05216559_3040 [Halomicrobium zhouii]|uniref:Uncharacterized protein n=1 Tax=Halomicrobium zhouii TaxID=767519 RepID=A0A1I6LSQ2_9EURY|nr:hypothetical protein [Halomicrobium zhouii]MCU4799499.1 hypothetical protein [Halobacteria archaeon HArc-gm2]SFS06448.1 hypothetical protein SAMN05216559_3040 [Halomicrobium zhouii]